ncbi:hypothetical protein IMSAGC019_02507 [Lachnospiraceae bacterium]|nr:hypothetical protein IMSAGC019_02507 [Lachnospiraceae bacterium]
MGNAEIDMEITPERAARIKETLLRLYADQMGWDYDTMEVTIEKVSQEPV